jgi:hypothetical protein
MGQLNDEFPTIETARTAIKTFILDEGESYKTIASDQKCFIVAYKDNICKFCTCATRSTKEKGSITIFEPCSCGPATHYQSRQSQSIKYLMEHHRVSVIDNRKITAGQIQSNELVLREKRATVLLCLQYKAPGTKVWKGIGRRRRVRRFCKRGTARWVAARPWH